MSSKSLKSTIQIHLIVAITIPLLITSTIILFFHYKSIKEHTISHDIRTIGLLTKQMAKEFQQAEDRLASLAILLDNDAIAARYLTVVIERIIESQANLTEVRILDANDYVKTVIPDNAEIQGFDMSGEVFIKNTKANRASTWSKAHLSPITKAPSSTLAVPFSNGIVVGVFDFVSFHDALKGIGSNQNLKAAVIDKGGVFISHTDDEKVRQREWTPTADLLRDHFHKMPQSNVTSMIIDGWIVTGSLVSNTGWLVILYQNHSAILTPIWRLSIWLILVSLLLVGLSGYLSFKVSSKYFSYFQRLISKIHHVANGDYAQELSTEGYQELQKVSVDFYKMTQEIKARQEETKKHNERYRIVADYTYDWEQWLSPEGDIEYISPSCERITGFARQDFINTPSMMFSIVHLEDKEKVRHHFKSLHKSKTAEESLEFRIITKYKKIRWLHHHCRPVYADDGRYLGRRVSNKDITERKQNEKHLIENEQRFRELFNNMRAGVAIYFTPDDGKNFYFKDLNRAGLESSQINLSDVIGKDVRNLFPGVEHLGLFNVFQQVYKTGIPAHHPTSLYKDQRLEMHVENYVCKLPSGELVAIFDDITGKVQAEEEKKNFQARIQQAQKMESIGNLAGGIAHDFNNLLFPIIGMAELLLEDLEPGSLEYQNAMEIFKAGQRGSDLVNQILSFSRQEELKLVPTRYQLILKEVLKLSRSTIPSNIEIRENIQPDCGMILANPTQLHQIAMNLITNAYHAVEDINGTIDIGLTQTQLDENNARAMNLDPGKHLIFSVSDNGNGIPADLVTKLFDPYFTTKEKGKGKGTGLGLSIVFSIVKEFKGHITVSSKIGKGTTFFVYLPIIKPEQNQENHTETVRLKKGTENILLVDDESAVVQMYRQLLERLGYQVVSYLNPLEALREFIARPDDFDLVITDMAMPHLTGDQLALELMKIKPQIPIIICTGFSEKINKDIAQNMGIKGLLMKPLIQSELADMIRSVLDT